jgi:hypothetical protein
MDSIINFGESLPLEELKKAEIESRAADLAIVLGTSLRVSPACDLPLMIRPEGKLCICNLQKTPFDQNSNSIVIHTKCDDLMKNVMEKLGIDIPDFIFELKFKLTLNSGNKSLKISEPNTDLSKILNGVFLVDDKKKEHTFNNKFEITLINYKNGDVLELSLNFNILKQFKGYLRFDKTCNVLIQLNTTQSTMSYNLS